jgi:A/G-specific adenine glycosylase
MELGALVCSPRAPRCLACPVRSDCLAFAGGSQDRIPSRAERKAPEEVREAAVFVERGGRVLLLKRGRGGLWSGFWELPTLHGGGPDPAGRGVAAGGWPGGEPGAFEALTGLRVELEDLGHLLRYGVTRYKVELALVSGRSPVGDPRPGPGHDEAGWFDEGSARGLAVGSAQRRALEWYFRRDRGDRDERP